LIAVITVLLAAATFGLITRFVVLIVLAAAAPLALALHALPQTDGLARLWWQATADALAVPVGWPPAARWDRWETTRPILASCAQCDGARLPPSSCFVRLAELPRADRGSSIPLPGRRPVRPRASALDVASG
jgi:hypothetical protein